MMHQKILRFKISLSDSNPEIWREIDVPDHYNFWELHVAIQDAFGWLDYHLHEFTPRKNGPTNGKPIGILEAEHDDRVVAGWEFSVKKYFTSLGNTIDYIYDFGDNWHHEVVLVGMFLAPLDSDFPQCVAGGRACPPEDCGGMNGYLDLLEVISNKKHEEYKGTVQWLKGHAKSYWPHKPESFDSKRVKFSDPYHRWCVAFNQPYEP